MKRQLNFKVLGILFGSCILVGVGVYFLHGYQVKRNAHVLLKQADLAEADGNLQQAALFLRQYLGLMPEDNDALAKYGLTIEKLALNRKKLEVNRRQLEEAFSVYQQVLRRDPDRIDVRKRAARITMMLTRFDAALGVLGTTRLPNDDPELMTLRAVCYERKPIADHGKAKFWYKAAIDAFQCSPSVFKNNSAEEDSLDLADACLGYARVLRAHPHSNDKDKPDNVMDALVGNPRRSFRAHVTMAVYQLEKKDNDKAETYASNARAIAPTDAEVFRVSGIVALARDRVDEAIGYFRKGRAAHPQDARLFELLRAVLLQRGDRQEAIAFLQQAVQEQSGRGELRWDLADLLISEDKLREAEAQIKQLHEAGYAKERVDFLRARTHVARMEWSSAIRLLNQVQLRLTSKSDIAGRTNAFLAQCHQAKGNLHQRFRLFNAMVRADPSVVAGQLGLGSCLTALGRIDDALAAYQAIMDKSTEARIRIVRILTGRTLSLPKLQREWDEVDKHLAELQKQPESLDAMLARAEVFAVRGMNQAVAEEMKLAGKKHTKDAKVEVLRARLLALSAERSLGAVVGGPFAAELLAIQHLNKAKERLGESVEISLAKIAFWARLGGVGTVDELIRLEQEAKRFNPNEQYRVLSRLAAAYSEIKRPKQAQIHWQRIQGKDGFDCRYSEAQHLLAVAAKGPPFVDEKGRPLVNEKGQRIDPVNAADELLTKLQSDRPSSFRVALSQAQLSELRKNEELALDHYVNAVKFGARDYGVVRRAVELLFKYGRVEESGTLIAELTRRAFLRQEFQTLTLQVAQSSKVPPKVLALAKDAVEENRTSSSMIWLGMLQWAADNKRDAEKTLRRASADFKTEPEVWVALVVFLARTEQKAAASSVIRQAQSNLSDSVKPLTLARCYTAVDDRDKARAEYVNALKIAPDDVVTLQRAAGFYVRDGALDEAEKCYSKLMSKKDEAIANRARRAFAMALVADGDLQKARRALEVAGITNPDKLPKGLSSDEIGNLRFKALVLAVQRDWNSRETAIQLLNELVAKSPPTPQDRLLLALLYRGAGKWKEARAQMEKLLAIDQKNANYVAVLVDDLISHDELTEAGKRLDQLKKLDSNSFRTASLEARFLKAQKKDADATQVLERFARTENANPLTIAMLMERLKMPQAEKMYRIAIAKSESPEAPLVLAQYFGRQDRVDEALDVCLQVRGKCKPEIFAATCTSIIYGTKAQKAHVDKVGTWLQAEIAQDKNNSVQLQMHLAALRNLQKRYPEVERIYQDVLNRDRNRPNLVALNNLALFLALSRNKPQDGLPLIDRALQIAGPLRGLLDTRAVIHLQMGQPAKAVDDLLQVVQDNPIAENYFHLARAYYARGDRKAARGAWDKAVELGLHPNEIHPLERPALANLTQELGKK